MNEQMKNILEYCSNIHLLYVEDNDSAREYTLELLSRFFHTISTAIDGSEALKIFENEKIDLIISDVNMPKMDGLEMSSYIKKIDKSLPIILLSAHNESNFKNKAKETGIETYLEKPLSLTKLIELLSIFAEQKNNGK